MNTVLVVASHPDDEALGCAGAIAKHNQNGDKVHLLFMTNGIGSRTKNPDEIKARLESTNNASKILGVHSSENLDFPDNEMDSTPLLEVVKKIEKTINKVQPNIVYTHHIGDLNIDHQLTHKAVITACRPQPGFCVKEIYSFEVLSSTEWQTPGYLPFTPNVYIDISNQIDIKRQALGAYSQEMRLTPHSRSIENAICLNALRGNAIGVGYAEAFFAIRILK